MNEIRKVRVQDASRIKSVIGFDTVAAAQDHIRKNIYYTDESFSVLARSSYTSKYSVTVRFIGSVDDVFADALLKFETLNRAEFLALMETGEVPENLGGDKPRTTQEVLSQARDDHPERFEESKPEKSADDTFTEPGDEI
jgi:hypothetical protein